MRGLNTTRPAGNSATATAPVTPADSKFLLILFLPYNKLSIWYVGSRTSEPSKANLCNRRSVVGQSKVVKYLKFGRMLRVRVLPSPREYGTDRHYWRERRGDHHLHPSEEGGRGRGRGRGRGHGRQGYVAPTPEEKSGFLELLIETVDSVS